MVTTRKCHLITCVLVCSALGLSYRSGMAQDTRAPARYVIEDFEDVGTWAGGSRNNQGVSFPFTSFGGSDEEHMHGAYVGRFRYVFDDEPREMSVSRLKVQKRTVDKVEGIEFYGNPKGYDCTLRFAIIDKRWKSFPIDVELSGDSWRTYRIPVNEDTAPGIGKAQPPFCLRKIVLLGGAPGTGDVFVDDITLVGDVESEREVAIKPVYQGIHHAPGESVVLKYRLRNATPSRIAGRLKLAGAEFYGEPISGEADFSLQGYETGIVPVALGELPIGHYTVDVSVVSGERRWTYEGQDQFGVFRPNGRRLNTIPMWFGIQEHEIWLSAGEQKLHDDWLRALGVDLARFWMTGNRLERQEGQDDTLPGAPLVTTVFDRYSNLGMDVLFLYMSIPEFLWSAKKGQHPGIRGQRPDRFPPNDIGRFETHLRKVGRLIAQHPHVRYFEFWNEPEIGFYYGTKEQYAPMAKAAFRALRATAPEVLITNGGATMRHPIRKPGFNEMVFTELHPYYDICAHHGHGTPDHYEQVHEDTKAWIRKSGRNPDDVRICDTECGQRNHYTTEGRRAQLDALVKKIVYSRAENMEFYIWFLLQDVADMWETDDSWGIVTSDNRVNPGFVAYNELIRQLADTRASGRPEWDPQLQTYEFTHVGTQQRRYVCWPRTPGRDVLLAVATETPVIATNVFGNTVLHEPDARNTVLVPVPGYPVYLSATDGRTLTWQNGKESSSFVQCPERVRTAIGSPAAIPITLNNVWTVDATVRWTLCDGRGTIVAQGERRLLPGGSARVEMMANREAKTSWGEYPHTLMVDVAEHGVRGFRCPLTVEVAQPIALVPEAVDGMKPAAASEALQSIALRAAASVYELTHDPAIPKWGGPDDLSAAARFAHDRRGILFVFDVTDDRHTAARTDTEFWREDSIQIACLSEGGTHTDFGMVLSTSEEGQTAVWCHITPNKEIEGRWEDVPVDIKRDETLTQYRLYVPFDLLGIDYRPGTPLRLAFIVNENDGQGRVRYLRWFRGIGQRKDPNLFGFAVLQ